MASILYIEDDQGVRDATKEVLTKAGHEVEEVDSVGAARSVFAFGGPHGLVITDYKLLGSERGLDFVRHIRENGHTTPVLLLSDTLEADIRKENADYDELGVTYQPKLGTSRYMLEAAIKRAMTAPKQDTGTAGGGGTFDLF